MCSRLAAFVSSDTPIESQRFADGILGDGFVVRAIDASNIAPWKDVQRLQGIAATHAIKMQYGVTGRRVTTAPRLSRVWGYQVLCH